ncbi:MAG TPA: hypothetical protein VII99_09490 [Bacteroidia bacterium]
MVSGILLSIAAVLSAYRAWLVHNFIGLNSGRNKEGFLTFINNMEDNNAATKLILIRLFLKRGNTPEPEKIRKRINIFTIIIYALLVSIVIVGRQKF